MERFDVAAIAAFELMRTLSREMNVPVVEFARRSASRESPLRDSG